MVAAWPWRCALPRVVPSWASRRTISRVARRRAIIAGPCLSRDRGMGVSIINMRANKRRCDLEGGDPEIVLEVYSEYWMGGRTRANETDSFIVNISARLFHQSPEKSISGLVVKSIVAMRHSMGPAFDSRLMQFLSYSSEQSILFLCAYSPFWLSWSFNSLIFA